VVDGPTSRDEQTLTLSVHRRIACLLLLAGTLSCADSGEDAVASIFAPETYGALSFAVPLPSLPLLARDLGLDATLQPSLAVWVDSWALDPDEGRDVRRDSYERVVPVLSEHMSDEDVRERIDAVALGLSLSRGLGSQDLPEGIWEALDHAQRHHAGALAYLAAGDRESALSEALMAGDALQEASPEAVATLMVLRGDEALRRAEGVGSYTDQELERADRLLRGARYAITEGDPVKAIRRAFYACRILSVELN
jgi:hypothetical protein